MVVGIYGEGVPHGEAGGCQRYGGRREACRRAHFHPRHFFYLRPLANHCSVPHCCCCASAGDCNIVVEGLADYLLDTGL